MERKLLPLFIYFFKKRKHYNSCSMHSREQPTTNPSTLTGTAGQQATLLIFSNHMIMKHASKEETYAVELYSTTHNRACMMRD
jgi:hypothetical protein